MLPLALIVGFAAQAAFKTSDAVTIVAYAIIGVASVRAAFVSRGFSTMSWGSLTRKQTLLYGVLIGLALPIAAIAVTIVAKALSPSLATNVTLPSVASNPAALIPNIVYVVLPLLLAPIAETALFQVWLQSGLARSPWLSLMVGSACFLAIHLQLSPMLVSSAVGLCALRAFARSAASVLVAHVLSNGLVLAFVLMSGYRHS